ncbi:MAG: type II secretion system F family protein [Pirellulales bacterium]
MSSHMILIVVGIVGMVLCLLPLSTCIGNTYERRVLRRCLPAVSSTSDTPTPDNAESSSHPASADRWNFLLPRRSDDVENLRRRLTKAGFRSPQAMQAFFGARMIGMVAPIVVACAYAYFERAESPRIMAAGALTSALGYLLPTYLLQRRVENFKAEISRGLPDFLDLTVICLEGGLSLTATLQRVTEELGLSHPSLGNELAMIQRDVALGTSLDRAFRNFADRTNIESVRTLSSFVRESMRFGSELAASFRDQADLMRYQREQLAEEQAQKASVKLLFPMLLLILPAVFVVLAGPAAIQIHESFTNG